MKPATPASSGAPPSMTIWMLSTNLFREQNAVRYIHGFLFCYYRYSFGYIRLSWNILKSVR